MSEIFDKAKDLTEKLTDKISDFKDNIFGEEEKEISEEFKDTNKNKITEIVEYLENSNEIILKSGFELTGLGISIAISPVIKASFNFKNKISPEEKDNILKEVTDKKIIKLVLNCLFKASDFVDSIKVGNYKLAGVDVSLGLTPGISVSFKK